MAGERIMEKDIYTMRFWVDVFDTSDKLIAHWPGIGSDLFDDRYEEWPIAGKVGEAILEELQKGHKVVLHTPEW